MGVENHTAAFKIWNYYWECMIAQHYVLSDATTEIFGFPTSGNKEVDRNLANSKMRVQLTIDQMVEYFDKGAEIEILEIKDTVKIYEIVNRHLSDWHSAVHVNAAIVEAPMEDLRKMDRFASDLYRIAKTHMEVAPVGGQLAQRIRAMEGRRAIGRRSKEEVKKTVPTEHKGLSEDIGKESFRRTNRFR